MQKSQVARFLLKTQEVMSAMRGGFKWSGPGKEIEKQERAGQRKRAALCMKGSETKTEWKNCTILPQHVYPGLSRAFPSIIPSWSPRPVKVGREHTTGAGLQPPHSRVTWRLCITLTEVMLKKIRIRNMGERERSQNLYLLHCCKMQSDGEDNTHLCSHWLGSTAHYFYRPIWFK